MSNDFMAKPCAHCPYRKDIKPYLTPERGEELAFAAQNPYNYFPCHKTTEHDDDGDCIHTEKEKMCAGFLTVQAVENGKTAYDEGGFEPSFDICFDGSYDMAYAFYD